VRLEKAVMTVGHEGNILDISDDESQSAVNLLLNALQTSRFRMHRRRIHRLLVKLSLKYNVLPASLFLHGVKFSGEECHSSGSFADIYLGELDGSQVALKRLRMFQMVDESRRTQLQRAFHHESLIWRGLDHPHILPFLGVDNSVFKRSPCMVSPWMGYGNVRSAAHQLRSSLPTPAMVTQLLTWVHQITLGLAYLHSEGIVHGDVRGPNILVDSDRSAKLTDFGLAVFSEGASRSYGSTRGGNARWLSPELIYPELFNLSSDRPTCASDVFALGCVCVELITFQAPYSGISDNQVIARVPLGLRPERPQFADGSDIPDALWSTITLCWQTDASHRPGAEALTEATKSLITQRAITPPNIEADDFKVANSLDDGLEKDDGEIGNASGRLVSFTPVVERHHSVGGSVVSSPSSGRRRSSAHAPYPSPSTSPPPSACASEGHSKWTTRWKCPNVACEASFSRQLHLKQHLRSHADHPYKCTRADCGRSFAKKQKCKLHEEKHHPALLSCEGCKRSFLTTDSLNRHTQSDLGKECKKYQGIVYDELAQARNFTLFS